MRGEAIRVAVVEEEMSGAHNYIPLDLYSLNHISEYPVIHEVVNNLIYRQ